MKTKIIFSILFFVAFYCKAQTQVAVIREWVKHFAIQDSIMESPSVKDAHQNYYVAGYTWTDSTGADIVVVKYDRYGNEKWSNQFTGSGYNRDQATAICVDPDYSVYVTGITFVDSSHGFDYVTIKYDSSGSQQWVKFYNGNYTGGYDVPVSIVPLLGYVFVTGTSQDSTGLLDIVTIRYKGSNGNVGWTNHYDYSAHLYDVPRAMKAGGTRINVTGGSQNSYLDWDYVSLMYDTSGSLLSATRVNNTGSSFDRANAVALTDSGIAYITGRAFIGGNDYDIRTVKLNPSGSIQWIRSYDYNGLMDEATSIDVDAEENIYVTGYGTADSANEDYITLKYDSSGDLQWIKYFNGSGNGKDIAWDIDVDSIGTAYVTGETYNGANSDFCTIAYQTSDGLLLWKDIYDGIGHCNDKATNVVCDTGGVVYVSGQGCVNDSTYEYVTIRYYSRHVLIPPSDSTDTPTSVGYYTNFGQIVDTDDSVRMDIKYYSVNHYPFLYFFEPDTSNDYTVMSYVFSHVDNDTATNDTLHRVDLTFESYDKTFEPMVQKTHALAVDKSENGLMNYYLHQCPNGITGVEGYKRISYPDAFFKTDIQFYGNGSGMKIYIIVKPDGEPDIDLKFTGQDSLIITDSTLTIVTSLGNYTYVRPIVFQIDSLGNRQDVAWAPEYVDLDSGRVGFALQSYYTDMPLVIEVGRYVPETPPSCTQDNFQWSALLGTFNGMAMDNTSDNNGNVFICGNTWNANNIDFPINNAAAISQTFGGGLEDCFIAKFKPINSTQLTFPYNIAWCTYYGGTLREYASSIAVNNTGDVYVVGNTEGSLPALSLVQSPTGNFNYNTFQGGTNDGFILKISDITAVPSIIWSSYIGGSNISGDFPMQVEVNQNLSSPNYRHVYVAGLTYSSDFPLQPSNGSGTPYDQTAFNGSLDGFIMRFDDSDILRWSSFFGGNVLTTFGSIAIASDDKVIIGGFTESNNPSSPGPGNPGVQTAANANNNHTLQLAYPSGSPYFDDTPNGYDDALLVSFNANDELIWATYFGGSVDDWIYSNSITVAGTNFYVLGQTDSPPGTPPGSDFPLLSGPFYQSTYGGGSFDCFIAEFKESDFGQNWTTYFGGSGNEGVAQWTPGGGPGTGAIAVDNTTGIIYIAGNTTSSSSSSSCTALSNGDFPLCNNLCIPSYTCSFGGTGGYPDAFVAAFSGDDLIWSTYLGGDNSCITSLNISSASGPTWLNFVSSNTTTFANPGYAFPTFLSNSGNYIFYNNSLISPNQLPPVDGRFDISCITGIVDAEVNNPSGEILIYPNPTEGELNIAFNLETATPLTINIFDAIGRIASSIKLRGNKGINKFSLSLSGLVEGIYFVQLKTKDLVKGKKFVIDR